MKYTSSSRDIVDFLNLFFDGGSIEKDAFFENLIVFDFVLKIINPT